MDFFGRKTVIAFGSFVFSIAMVLMVLSTNYTSLMLSRLLQGISIGFLLTVIPVYIAESSSINFRGRSMGIFQLSLASGIFLANVLASIFAVKYGWRVVFLLAIPFSVILFLLTFIAPYSPVWLQMKGRSKEAKDTSMQLFSTFQEKLENHVNKKTGFEEFLTAIKTKKMHYY